MGVEIPQPLPVRPHIRFFRWCFLIAGAAYGFKRHSDLYEIEKVLKVQRAKIRRAMEKRIALERQLASDRDVAALAALAEPPDDD